MQKTRTRCMTSKATQGPRNCDYSTGTCCNDMFRKTFCLNRWESVKLVQYYCGVLDFKHYYDLYRWRFLSRICSKLPHLNTFFVAREFELNVCRGLETMYCMSLDNAFASAVYCKFRCVALTRSESDCVLHTLCVCNQ